jgi:hypothetical protein
MDRGTKIGSIVQDRTAWLMLLFVLMGVLLPTGCVLWFMNDAARSQADAARRSVVEAYRGQLRLVRDQVDSLWRSRAAALKLKRAAWTSADFPRTMAAAGADSVILLGPKGTVEYPTPLAAPSVHPATTRPDWQAALGMEWRGLFAESAAAYEKLADSERDPRLAALAAQAQIRCFARGGAKGAALAAIRRRFGGAGSQPAPHTDLNEAIAAGPMLPGWRIAFSLLDTKPFDEAARGRMVSYLWAGYLVVAAMAVTGFLVGRSLRRQWRLARLKTDLVATVSHELKTPLASMRLLVDSLLEDEKLDPEKTRDYLDLISGENQRLSRLIENFLTFSRIERNRQRFEFGETRPEDVVRTAVHAMRERLQPPACRLDVDIAPTFRRSRPTKTPS